MQIPHSLKYMSTCCRFLKDEWHYLNQDNYFSDLPISEKVWKNLPRRISEADIQVSLLPANFMIKELCSTVSSEIWLHLDTRASQKDQFVLCFSLCATRFRNRRTISTVVRLFFSSLNGSLKRHLKGWKGKTWEWWVISNSFRDTESHIFCLLKLISWYRITYHISAYSCLNLCVQFIQFDKKWFRPDEASALRTKIRNKLIELFRISDQTDQTSTDNAASKSRHCSPL